MTGIHKSLGTYSVANAAVSSDPWVPLWPNPPDLPYNFFNLLDRVNTEGIANLDGDALADKTIAIIGAGYAGMTVAKELWRCGFKNIEIYETQAMISLEGDTDLAEAIINLQQQQTILQAALQTTGQLLQLSILDFLG